MDQYYNQTTISDIPPYNRQPFTTRKQEPVPVFYNQNIEKPKSRYWYYLIAFIIILLITILSVVIYIAVKLNEPKKSVKVIDNNYALTEDDIGKHLLPASKDLTITVPRDSSDWNGVVTIENFHDIVNTLKIDTSSNIRIVEYDGDTLGYDDETQIDGNIIKYQNKSGSVDLINYLAEIKFVDRLTSINVTTVIADNLSIQ